MWSWHLALVFHMSTADKSLENVKIFALIFMNWWAFEYEIGRACGEVWSLEFMNEVNELRRKKAPALVRP